jgi:hypothetical protein
MLRGLPWTLGNNPRSNTLQVQHKRTPPMKRTAIEGSCLRLYTACHALPCMLQTMSWAVSKQYGLQRQAEPRKQRPQMRQDSTAQSRNCQDLFCTPPSSVHPSGGAGGEGRAALHSRGRAGWDRGDQQRCSGAMPSGGAAGPLHGPSAAARERQAAHQSLLRRGAPGAAACGSGLLSSGAHPEGSRAPVHRLGSLLPA